MEVWVSTILTTPWTCSTLVWRHSSKNLGRNRITSTENRAAIWQPCFHATGAPIRLPESHPVIRRPSYSAVTKALRLLKLPLKEPPQHGLSLIHISEPTRLRRISYAVFCLKKKTQ